MHVTVDSRHFHMIQIYSADCTSLSLNELLNEYSAARASWPEHRDACYSGLMAVTEGVML